MCTWYYGRPRALGLGKLEIIMQVFLLVLATAIGLSCAEAPVTLDKDSFAETVGAGKPVFVKFFAPW